VVLDFIGLGFKHLTTKPR